MPVCSLEIDEAPCDIRANQPDLNAIPHVDPVEPLHQFPLDGLVEDANPRPLGCRARDNGLELFLDSRRQEKRGGGFPHEPLDLVRVILLLGAVS